MGRSSNRTGMRASWSQRLAQSTSWRACSRCKRKGGSYWTRIRNEKLRDATIEAARKQGQEDILQMVEEWDSQVDHFYRLSDCLRSKLNMISKRKLRKNPRYKGMSRKEYEARRYERDVYVTEFYQGKR